MSKFTTDNTEGFSQEDCDVLNAVVRILVADGYDADRASDLANDAWVPDDSDNTVKALVDRITGREPQSLREIREGLGDYATDEDAEAVRAECERRGIDLRDLDLNSHAGQSLWHEIVDAACASAPSSESL